MNQGQQSRWRPTRRRAMWIGLGGIAFLFVAIVVFGGYYFEWKWTGYSKRTPWDWLKVLAIPITVGAAVPLLNWLQKKRELDVENQRAQDEALQAYLDQIGKLLLDEAHPLRAAREDDEVQTLARALTLTALGRLDGGRKRSLVRFLYESALIGGVHAEELLPRGVNQAVVPLYGADLRDADLRSAYLFSTNLDGANLGGADLRDAYLSNATLWHADLRDADLCNTDLSGAKGVTNEQLEQQARSLEGATMPDGSMRP